VGQKKLRRKPYRRRRWRSYLGFRGKTVWDLLPIGIAFLIPLVIALGTWRIPAGQGKLEDQRAQVEQELAEQRAQDEALQAYLGQMGTLMLEKDLRNSKEDSEVRTLARARTLTVLRRLDTSRRNDVVQFLLEAHLVQRVGQSAPAIELDRADLRGVDLSIAALTGVDLSGVDLSNSDLSNSDLSSVDLSAAYLSDVDLSNAYLNNTDLSDAIMSDANLSDAKVLAADLHHTNLIGADLSGADLFEANLSDASLSYADMRNASLSRANLSGADLSQADLSDAKRWTEKQLSAAVSLEGATMPNGQILRSDDNPDAPSFEEWLNSKDRE
jgi:uncharacterized protein YjbI with pentapeptide repeats